MIVHKFSGQIKTKYFGYNKLIDFYCAVRKFKNVVITLDFYSLHWIDANMCAILQAMINKLGDENNLQFSTDADYLKSKFPILFKNGFVSNLEKIEDTFDTAIKLEKFVFGEDDNRYKEYISTDLMSHRGLSCLDEKIAASIRSHLFEIYCNIEHSQSVDVITCGQYFPKKKRLSFTLLDMGVGYLEPINKKDDSITSSAQAICWALKEGNTTRLGAPGGGGLTDVLNYFENDEKGKIEIITGDAYWTSLSNTPIKIMPNQFCGTTVNLVFNLN